MCLGYICPELSGQYWAAVDWVSSWIVGGLECSGSDFGDMCWIVGLFGPDCSGCELDFGCLGWDVGGFWGCLDFGFDGLWGSGTRTAEKSNSRQK